MVGDKNRERGIIFSSELCTEFLVEIDTCVGAGDGECAAAGAKEDDDAFAAASFCRESVGGLRVVVE